MGVLAEISGYRAAIGYIHLEGMCLDTEIQEGAQIPGFKPWLQLLASSMTLASHTAPLHCPHCDVVGSACRTSVLASGLLAAPVPATLSPDTQVGQLIS